MLEITLRLTDTRPSAEEHPTWSETSSYHPQRRQWISAFGEINIGLDASHRVDVFEQGVVIHDGRIHAWELDERRFNGCFLAIEFPNGQPDIAATLITDRFGTIPLYWGMSRGSLWISSKLSSLVEHGFSEPDIIANWQLVLFNHPLWERSLLSGVSLLPPANRISLFTGQPPQLTRYWSAPESTGGSFNSEENVDQLIYLLRTAQQRAIGARPIAYPVTGGLDSRINLALRKDQLHTGVFFHVYARRSVGTPVATRIARAIGHDLMMINEVDGVLRIPSFDPNRETGELNMWQCWLNIGAEKLSQTAAEHVMLDGYMMDVLFNPIIPRADPEPSTMHNAIVAARHNYSLLGQPSDGQTINAIVNEFRLKYLEERSTSPLQASQRYYLENRSRRFVFGTARLAQNHIPVAVPGVDNDLLEFGFSLPWQLRKGAFLYRQAIAHLAPELAAIPHDKTDLPLLSRRASTHKKRARDALIRNLDRLWPTRPFLRPPESDLVEIFRSHPDVAKSIVMEITNSSWVGTMLCGQRNVELALHNALARGRSEIVLSLLTIANLETLIQRRKSNN